MTLENIYNDYEKPPLDALRKEIYYPYPKPRLSANLKRLVITTGAQVVFDRVNNRNT